jgi:hypothetical protein
MAPLSEPVSNAERTPEHVPKVSIVLTGRNDDHGADFRSRFFRTLRFNHQELTSRGIAHEFLFVEWAPLGDRPRLVDLIFDAIPELDPGVCSWYIVDSHYQDALSHNPRLVYLEFIAKNVGVRRAAGHFVLTSNCDVFFGRRVLDALQGADLKSGVVYRAARHDLRATMGEGALGWNELEDPRNLEGEPRTLKPPFMGGGTGDFLLLDRRTFHEIRGFNEVYRAARIGIDRNFIVKALSSGLPIEDIGGPVYHVNHAGSFRLAAPAYVGREAEAPWGDRRWHSGGVIYVNPPTWGLAKAPVTQVGPRQWYVAFRWDAVPPLVDLKAIVLPVSRLGGPSPGVYKSVSRS